MPIITLQELKKVFRLKQKAPGLRGSFRALLRPEYQTVEAVKGISLEMEQGELLAFIGPNGAGKSTTIKMLTGILYPSSGEASVLGYIPWQQRRELSYHIGSIFGQKPQLWYHLPPIDTFELFAHLYELEPSAFRQRRDFLVEAFSLEELLHVPVRKLSLGQRMRCEVAASLLHRPRILFLDEPTIGLDVVAKQKLREAIKLLHEQEKLTIFLTSHDVGDVEALCRRVIVINHGQVIFDDTTSALKRRFLHKKIISVRFGQPVPEDFSVKNATLLKRGEWGVKIELDTRVRPVDNLIQAIMNYAPVMDINVEDPPMEDVIREIYAVEETIHLKEPVR
ncbi:MAG: ATP-binding cassette domain-containing protein [Anaerolineae bacterium]|nr:MAG: ATP-binding cassette domain-containing protein [Anaerolineae bacterium]MCL4879429.1 ATP-binding cassette domain-containing protein [Anaerolineae bacterium]